MCRIGKGFFVFHGSYLRMRNYLSNEIVLLGALDPLQDDDDDAKEMGQPHEKKALHEKKRVQCSQGHLAGRKSNDSLDRLVIKLRDPVLPASHPWLNYTLYLFILKNMMRNIEMESIYEKQVAIGAQTAKSTAIATCQVANP
ncbi:hypothetical protein D5086_014117 [Populus alba]|uniref:Uncharacterized protein n=1 Tax=Populus alba TaxID=43335 RepID=A0ACC4C7G1_POPAL